MRVLTRRILASSMCLALLAVSSLTVSASEFSQELAVRTAATILDRDATVITANDFVAAAPYVVVLDIATPVPIELATAGTQVEQRSNRNAAVKQNVNFERQ